MGKTNNLFELRKEYTQGGLSENDIQRDPILQFNIWLEQAVKAGITEPNAMTLATAASDGRVSARILLLKEVDSEGFVFFTNYNSNKAQQLAQNHCAALVFLWLELERQVRIEGVVSKIDNVESELYFSSRPRESQLGAWASEQSSEIASRAILDERYHHYEKLFLDKPIPKPPNWGGYRLIPIEMEFWQGRPGRMHDRILYGKKSNQWIYKRLSP